MAALEQNDRVCKICLWDIKSSALEEFLAPMQEPYLELSDLWITWDDRGAPQIVPESFLGGSAPRLQRLTSGKTSLANEMLATIKLLLSQISEIRRDSPSITVR